MLLAAFAGIIDLGGTMENELNKDVFWKLENVQENNDIQPIKASQNKPQVNTEKTFIDKNLTEKSKPKPRPKPKPVVENKEAASIDPIVEQKQTVAKADEKQILFSSGNLNWAGVGKLESGFNLVSAEAAAKWLTHRKVRKATVEEVKEHYKQ